MTVLWLGFNFFIDSKLKVEFNILQVELNFELKN